MCTEGQHITAVFKFYMCLSGSGCEISVCVVVQAWPRLTACFGPVSVSKLLQPMGAVPGAEIRLLLVVRFQLLCCCCCV